MTPSETERKLRQLDNDVQSIYEMLSAIQGTQARHGNRLQEHSEKLDTLETKIGGLDTKIGGLDTKIGGLDTKIGGLDTKIGGLDTKVDTVLELLRTGPTATG